MNPDGLLKHFEQISGAPRSVSDLWRFYLEYHERVVQIPQMPSGEFVTRKSQMASGFSRDTLLKRSVRISQMPSAKFVASFLLKKRLMEWAEAAVQNKLGRQ